MNDPENETKLRDSWKIQSGNRELDQLLRGGFLIPKTSADPGTPHDLRAEGLLVLIRGSAGTGKSTLAMQIARDAKLEVEPSADLYRHYCTLEQEKAKVEWCGGIPFEKTVAVNCPEKVNALPVGRIESLVPPLPFTEIADLIKSMHDGWESAVLNRKKLGGAVIVLDDLSVMTRDERREVRFAQFAETLRQFPGLAVIVYEPCDGEAEILDHRADVVIELEKIHLRRPVPYTIHRLHIRKTRYQQAVIGWHQYKFAGGILEILPSIHYQVHRPRMNEHKIQSAVKPTKPAEPDYDGESSLVERLVGRVDDGHCLALFGPRGSFKTQLSLDFLCAREPEDGSRFKSQSLLISLEVGGSELNVQCPFAKKRATKCNRKWCRLCNTKGLYGYHQPPGCITSAEFLHHIRNALTQHEWISRLAFWDITQLDHRFPLLKHDPLFLPAFLEMLRGKDKAETNDPTTGAAGTLDRKVKSLFMGAGNAKYTKAFAAIADNVIFCWRWEPLEPGKFVKRIKDRSGMKSPNRDIPNIYSHYEKLNFNVGSSPDFLLLYVDRTEGKFRQPNKVLYAVPIAGAKFPAETKPTILHIDPSQLSGQNDVTRRIDKINQLQGVE
jgi:hypothetical protein